MLFQIFLATFENSQVSAPYLLSLPLTATCTITSLLYPVCSDRKCDILASVHWYYPWGDGLPIQGRDEEDGHTGFYHGSTESPPHDCRHFVWEKTCRQACLHSGLLTFFRHPTRPISGIQQVLPFKQASVMPHSLLHNILVYSLKKNWCHSGLLNKCDNVYYLYDDLFKAVHRKGKFSSLFSLTNPHLLKWILKYRLQESYLVWATEQQQMQPLWR